MYYILYELVVLVLMYSLLNELFNEIEIGCRWYGLCPTQEWGVAWDLREIGSAQGKGVIGEVISFCS
jgi:hypothetical protein